MSFDRFMIHEKFGMFYSVGHIIAQLQKNMGYSYQKAAFVSDHKDPEIRKEWLYKTWHEIIKLARAKQAAILFGRRSVFPPTGYSHLSVGQMWTAIDH
ncbi:MAG: winged helix-turn-helix domain-containing protein [Syntrophobacteraceae bacterium]